MSRKKEAQRQPTPRPSSHPLRTPLRFSAPSAVNSRPEPQNSPPSHDRPRHTPEGAVPSVVIPPAFPRNNLYSFNLSRAVPMVSSAEGAFGFTRTLFAGIPTFTWNGRTSFVASAIAPTMPFVRTRTPASTVAW
jgi:hypothetical protein